MRFFRFAMIAVALALLAACGGTPQSVSVPPAQTAAPTQAPEPTSSAPLPTLAPSTAPPQPSADQPTAAPRPADTAPPAGGGSGVLVVLHRSGGIAAMDEMLTVYADGRLEFSDRATQKTAQAAPADLAALKKLLASPEFAALNAHYQAPGADMFIYEITIPGAGKPQQVVTMDGAKNPAILDQVLEELRKLQDQVR